MANKPQIKNIYKEIESDLGLTPKKSGDLTRWGTQGVLLLNSVLTVRENAPGSHRNKGWEVFTDSVIKKLSDSKEQGIRFGGKPVGTLMLMKCSAQDSFGELLPVSQSSVKNIMMYCRKPGMIVEYDTDSAWAKSINRLCQNTDDRFIGFFIVNSQDTFCFKDGTSEVKAPIESLFRNIEAPDHNEWKPEARPSINHCSCNIAIAGRVIERIKNIVGNLIPRDTASCREADAISNLLGQYFAAEGNPATGNTPGKTDSPGGVRRNFKKTSIEFKTPEYFSDSTGVTVKVPCRILANPEQKNIKFELKVAFEDSSYNQKQWKDVFASEEFPVKVITVEGGAVDKIDFRIEDNQLSITLAVDKKIELSDLRLVYSLSRRNVAFSITEEITQ